MKKTNFYFLFCTVIMLSSTVEVKPMLKFVALQNIKRILSASPYIAFVGVFSNIGIHYNQLKRVQELKQRCQRSENNTDTALERSRAETMSHSSKMPSTFISKEILLRCMKNKDENLQNYFYCEELLEETQDLFKKIYAEKGI